MDLLIKNIKGLVQVRDRPPKKVCGSEMAELPVTGNAWLIANNGKIVEYGLMEDLPVAEASEIIDASGRFVMPCFIDSHTHLVFAASRENEFVDKLHGLSYEEIAHRGGGILNSAIKLQQTSEEVLFQKSLERAYEIIGFGTAAVEIKSGYGLTVEDELKMLRVARRIGNETPLIVKTTFLGAHAIPKGRDRNDYIREVMEVMIPRVAEEHLADYCDVFCEKGFFTPEETEMIIERGKKYGMTPKIHANQLHNSGGVQAGVKMGALSVDHLESMGEKEIEVLQGSATMATMLPGAAFFLNSVYPPARRMIESGLAVSIATDYNPGSAPCGKMSFMISLACIKMKMTPQEALNAATINAAYAMGITDVLGTITPGKDASFIITKKIPSIEFIPYAFGSDIIDQVIIKGKTMK